jgi:hypothetical protein
MKKRSRKRRKKKRRRPMRMRSKRRRERLRVRWQPRTMQRASELPVLETIGEVARAAKVASAAEARRSAMKLQTRAWMMLPTVQEMKKTRRKQA